MANRNLAETFYCPYTNDIIETSNTKAWSWDHVVPLFMGGDDKFQIKSDLKANNTIGSKVEGPMKNDPLLSPALRESGIIGRSGTITIPEQKHSVVDGRKTHIRLEPDEWKFWDKIDRRYVDFTGRTAIPVETQLNLNIHSSLRLAAKILLGTFVFAFGEEVRHWCNLGGFRKIMNMQTIDDLASLKTENLRVLQRHDQEVHTVGSEGFTWNLMSEAFERTCLIITPHEDAFGFHVAIAGQHQASFQFPAVKQR